MESQSTSAEVRRHALRTIRRPRLLLLAYYFPPANKVGGIRPFNMAKALSVHGWDVTVVSPAVSMWRVVEQSDRVSRELEMAGIRCIRTEHRWRNLSPYDLACRDRGIAWMWGGICRRSIRLFGVEPQIGWFGAAARACSVLLPEDVDLVMATGPPFIGFRLAAQIASRLRRPYVLDYRDLRTLNPHSTRSARSSARSAESLLIAGAAAVLVVSEQLAGSLRERFGAEDKIHVVTNGYDPSDLATVNPREFGHFAVIYTGQFYPPKRVIGPLVAALARLKRMEDVRKEWRFHYFGPHGAHVREAIAGLDLTSEVAVHDNVSRSDALAALAGAGVSVVITSVNETGSREDLGVVTGKVFEAIGLRKPVLAIAPRGSDLGTILTVSGLGERFSGKEIEPMAKYLADLIGGRSVLPREPEMYSWHKIGSVVHNLLRGVLANNLRPTSEGGLPHQALLEQER